MILSYKFRIEPTKKQAVLLGEMLADFCELYNAALEHRNHAFAKGAKVGSHEQITSLPAIRRDLADQHGRWSCTAQQQVLRRLDKAFRSFFRRLNKGDAPGFPRFRARARYHAAEFRVGDGLTLRKSGKIGVIGVPGEIRVRWHRKLPCKPKSAILTQQAGKWYVVFHVDVPAVERSAPGSVGIDMGLISLVALSNGEAVARPNWTKRAERGLRKRNRAIARCKRGSSTRRKRVAALARYHMRIVAKRRDFCHKLSRDLVERFGKIAVEQLHVKGLARSFLAKHVNDAAWAQIISNLRYKAANAGAEFVEVDPRGTSQTCPSCGTIEPKLLATREHHCECGCCLDRDVAAAIVVHQRAFGFMPGSGIGSSIEPVAA